MHTHVALYNEFTFKIVHTTLMVVTRFVSECTLMGLNE